MTHKFIAAKPSTSTKRRPWVSGCPYEVMSVLPADENDSPYRVKSQAEPFARAGKEADLVAVGSATLGQPPPCAGPMFCLDRPSRPTMTPKRSSCAVAQTTLAI
jgi:hypothetical protein